jgi:putative surface-exposed virulence protein
MFRGTRTRVLLGIVAAAGLSPGLARGRTITVCVSGGCDYQNIRDAIAAAQDGDEIVVHNGTYTSTVLNENRDLDFGGLAITLRSLSDDPTACTIDCQATSQNRHRVFYFHSGESNGSVIRGFTIQGGYTATDPPGAAGPGGAILCDGASPTMFNCILVSNHTELQGGAIACLNGSAPDAVDFRTGAGV